MNVTAETIKEAWYADVNESVYGAVRWTDADLTPAALNPAFDLDAPLVMVLLYSDGYYGTFTHSNAGECSAEAYAFAAHADVRQVQLYEEDNLNDPVAVGDADGMRWLR